MEAASAGVEAVLSIVSILAAGPRRGAVYAGVPVSDLERWCAELCARPHGSVMRVRGTSNGAVVDITKRAGGIVLSTPSALLTAEAVEDVVMSLREYQSKLAPPPRDPTATVQVVVANCSDVGKAVRGVLAKLDAKAPDELTIEFPVTI